MNESETPSERRRAENEVVFKQHNQITQRQLETILPEDSKTSFAISFTCECSNEHCREQIKLTLVEFRKYHKNPAHFILQDGHAQPDIERMILKGKGYVVVEKLKEPPAAGHLNRT